MLQTKPLKSTQAEKTVVEQLHIFVQFVLILVVKIKSRTGLNTSRKLEVTEGHRSQ